MTRMKSGAILLLLAIPFALYLAWQVQAATRPQLVGTSAPSEKGLPSKEQLTASVAQTEKWASDVQRVGTVAFQYRQPGASDATDCTDCTATTKAVAARSADLIDLETFLADRDSPTFTGTLQARYTGWLQSRKELDKASDAIETWLRNPLPNAIDGGPAATQALGAFDSLVTAYRKDSKFANSSRVTAWRMAARVKVIEALEEAGRKPYEEVLALPLPLPNGKENKVVERAVSIPAAIRDQARQLDTELRQAENERQELPEFVTKAASATLRRADEWAAKEELIGLFADPELLTDPLKAGQWLPRIQEQYNRTQSRESRDMIRKKVQQFCTAYVPKALRLDDRVLIKGNEVMRAGVTIVYDSDAKSQPLTDHPNRLNEFNFLTAFKYPDQIVWANGGKYAGVKDSANLQPTLASHVARDYSAARTAVTIWTQEAVQSLKKICEGDAAPVQQERRKHADQLVGAEPAPDLKTPEPQSAWTRDNTRLWTRLATLEAAMNKHPGLFEPQP